MVEIKWASYNVKEGRILSNGKLFIVLRKDHQLFTKVNIKQKIYELKKDTGDLHIDVDEWYNEACRLCELAIRLVITSSINLFECLPLTESGDFPQDTPIVIAKSKLCSYSLVQFSHDGKEYAYPRIRQLQLRLVPGYIGVAEDLSSANLKDVMVLNIDLFNAECSPEPVKSNFGTYFG